jgi:hypothetical protein
MPPSTKDSMIPGPAYWAAAVPVRTKMPAPMIAPMPIAVIERAPSDFESCCSPSPLSTMSSTDLRPIRPDDSIAPSFQIEPGQPASTDVESAKFLPRFKCCRGGLTDNNEGRRKILPVRRVRSGRSRAGP